MGPDELEELKHLVTVRFGTIHAFAKARPGGLARSTVYMVLCGRYGGNLDRQAERIKAALGAPGSSILEALKEVACQRCRKKRRRSKQCEKCYGLWRAQEKAVIEATGLGV